MSHNIRYFSLDEARTTLRTRWNDEGLKNKIESILADKFIQEFKNQPRSVTFRQVITPDNGFFRFFMCAKYLGTEPLAMEYLQDIFVSVNVEKKGLGKLRISVDGKPGYLNILDFHRFEKKPLNKIEIKTGQKLVEFHHGLMNKYGYSSVYKDYSNWFMTIGKAKDYYFPLLLHFVAHGIFFETLEGDEHENSFTSQIMEPAVKKIIDLVGLEPIFVRIYPEDQTAKEDNYWWSYPPFINSEIISIFGDDFKSWYNIINTL